MTAGALLATKPHGAALTGVTTASKQDKNSRQSCPWFKLPPGGMGLDASLAVTHIVERCWPSTGSVPERFFHHHLTL